MRRIVLVIAGAVGAATLTLPGQSAQSAPVPATSTADQKAAPQKAAAPRVPSLHVTRMVRGLDIPWDVKPITGRRLLITEREKKRLLLWSPGGHLKRVRFPASTVWANGETGLMGLAVDPSFARNLRFYTCQGGTKSAGGHDVRVMAWQLRTRPLRAVFVRRLLVGIPSTSGRHGGCRLLIAKNGAMIVGTGDAATGTNPRNLSSLGGKTLRLNRFTGMPWKDNPWIGSSIRNRRYVMTFGHRNVQGLAQRFDGTVWSAEHGPDVNDEVNRLKVGGDYGWNPVPGYNEGVPMTDQSLPGTQIGARWRSGNHTLATSGIAWVKGTQWGAFRGRLAVAALKASRLMFMRFDASGRFLVVNTPRALTRFGRLRSVTNMPNGDLLVTTSNGGSHDVVLRVHPGR
jgi:glucose/arabinose dehydrogenase